MTNEHPDQGPMAFQVENSGRSCSCGRTLSPEEESRCNFCQNCRASCPRCERTPLQATARPTHWILHCQCGWRVRVDMVANKAYRTPSPYDLDAYQHAVHTRHRADLQGMLVLAFAMGAWALWMPTMIPGAMFLLGLGCWILMRWPPVSVETYRWTHTNN